MKWSSSSNHEARAEFGPFKFQSLRRLVAFETVSDSSSFCWVVFWNLFWKSVFFHSVDVLKPKFLLTRN